MNKNRFYKIQNITLLFFIVSFSFGQISAFDTLNLTDFNSFPPLTYRQTEDLIKEITPPENYDSWILKYKHYIGNKEYAEDILLKKGKWRKNINKLKNVQSNTGFFVGCMPSLCYYYIVGSNSDEIQLIDDKDKFKDFIGDINNLEELELTVRLNGYRIDTDTLLLGSYFETEEYYYLYLTRYEPSPEKYWSVKARLKKSGEFEVLDEKLFKSTGKRIIY